MALFGKKIVSSISGVASQSTGTPDSTASCNWMDCSMAMSAPIFTSERRSHGLDDDLDAFALLARAGKQRQIAKLGQHPAQFRLKNNKRAKAMNTRTRRAASAALSNPEWS
jgi:hypothetical protein